MIRLLTTQYRKYYLKKSTGDNMLEDLRMIAGVRNVRM